eukprot:m.339460 g.339460  ORF g.339460 m.339460 type:complete len:270 (+) comp18813_c0_seq1:67-876(+)
MEKFLESWMKNPWLVYGVGPIASLNIGFWVPTVLLEYAIKQPWAKAYQIQWTDKPREEAREEILEKFPFVEQAKMGVWNTVGATSVSNFFLLRYTGKMLFGVPRALTPALMEFARDFVLLEVIGDFFLYWGHRIQHESDFLWRTFHAYHHQIRTPTPISTLYIDPVDAMIQGGLPIIVAGAIVKPHPLTFYFYTIWRVAENVVNHSGMNHWSFDILFLKKFPFRAAVSHHDAHHRFSNYATNAKNYGEGFWIWDWAFGTQSKREPKALQ